MNFFVCCEREDETSYLHPCNCPSASFSCESEQISPRLCGFSEYTGDGVVASEPPMTYLVKTLEWEQYSIGQWACCPSGDDEGYHKIRTTTLSDPGTTVQTYDPLVNCNSYTITTDPSSNGCFSSAGYGRSSSTTQFCNAESSTSTACIPNLPNDSSVVSTTRIIREQNSRAYIVGGECDGQLEARSDELYSYTLSSADTEENAIKRETPEEGTSCSSLSETRSNGFSWVVRTSKYTIECLGLAIGTEYEVAPSIRKRTAVIGSYGEWEDVTISPTTFTATSDTKSFAAVALDHVQGYEYQITGVNIEKKA